MAQHISYRVTVNGTVQGVGFRPFIYNLAIKYGLQGWVRNTSGGVEIEVSGPETMVDKFLVSIKEDAPPLSKVDSLTYEGIPLDKHESFQILHSKSVNGAFQPISPDVSICDACLRELFTPTDFRFRYPFTNCTNCGPRFTIIKDIPYDRPSTTMARFDLCQKCKAEYEDPLNRRFHAQPVACPSCGPHVWLEYPDQDDIKPNLVGDSAIKEIQTLLATGKIVAVKGLGGFHLACDANNPEAIALLRSRKDRPHKPMAVMMPDVETVLNHCHLSKTEQANLISPLRPILLLEKRSNSNLPDELAPFQKHLGVMLPYTPLHYLLFSTDETFPDSPYSVLVMTSANYKGNPILYDNDQVRDQLDSIVDAFLFHDREIYIQCDDSVARIPSVLITDSSRAYPIRRSRGFTPQPINIQNQRVSVLGVGAELKNTFCLTNNKYAFLSQHIGDLKNYETLKTFEESITHFEDLFRVTPELLVYDSHPDYLSTRYALQRSADTDIPAIPVQHHHAHITSCLADNHYHGEEPVIGIAFDGIGYGDDGNIWGGEFLIANYLDYQRAGHLMYFPLPGGDLAIKQPWRTALALLYNSGLEWDSKLPVIQKSTDYGERIDGLSPIEIVRNQLAIGINCPLTSSIGRLFDGISALIGLRQVITYEGQAAIELEAIADQEETKCYPISIESGNIFNPKPLLIAIIEDLHNGISIESISAKFHNSIVEMITIIAKTIRNDSGINQVALSGGVWQNMTLLTNTAKSLTNADFNVFIHRQVPPNDGGLSLGQVVSGHIKLMDQGE